MHLNASHGLPAAELRAVARAAAQTMFGCDHPCRRDCSAHRAATTRPPRDSGLLIFLLLISMRLCAQGTPTAPSAPAPSQPAWAYSLTTDGYIAPKGQSYVSPVLTADHNWLHLEARYNYEDQRTGSLWAGYNFSAGKKLQLAVTPMIGGVFGEVTGIAPGCELSLTYKKLQFTSSSEYVFDTGNQANSFFYSWPELTYSLLDWLKVGFVAQHTKAFHTSLDTQRGLLVGFSYKQVEFTTYLLNPDLDQPTTILEVGVTF